MEREYRTVRTAPRAASPNTQRNLSLQAWRQRGYTVARFERVRLTPAELRALGGPEAEQAYNEGLRIGERERLKAMH